MPRGVRWEARGRGARTRAKRVCAGATGITVDGKWFGVLDSLLWAAGFVDSSSIEPIEEAIKERLDRPIEGLSTFQTHPRSESTF